MRSVPGMWLSLAALLILALPDSVAWAQTDEARQRFATLRLHNLHLQRMADCALTLTSAADGEEILHAVQVPPREVTDVDLVALAAARGGEFSGIVDCTRPVASILFYGDRATRMYGGYTGLAPPDISNRWHVLQAFTGHGPLLSRIVVQNGAQMPNQVRAEFRNLDDGSLVHVLAMPQIPGHGASALELEQMPGLRLTPEVQVSLTADYPVVPLVFHIDAGAGAAWHPEAAYESPLSLYVPSAQPQTLFHWPARLADFHGLSTDLLVQNPNTEPVTVRTAYPPFESAESVVAAGAVAELPLPDFLPRGYIASLVMRSDMPVHLLTRTRYGEGRFALHTATAARGRKLSAPLALKDADGFSSLVACQNTGREPTEAIFEYVGQFARVKVINPGRNVLISVHKEHLLPEGYSGAMIVRAEEPLKCVVLNLRTDLLEESPTRPAVPELRHLLMYEALALD